MAEDLHLDAPRMTMLIDRAQLDGLRIQVALGQYGPAHLHVSGDDGIARVDPRALEGLPAAAEDEVWVTVCAGRLA